MNICIVDHKRLLASSLRYLLTSHPAVDHVGIYATSEAFNMGDFSGHLPDIVITDNKKDGSSPHLLSDEGLARFPEAKFIIVATNAYPDMVKESIIKGALGYLTLDCSDDELFMAIDSVMQGKRYLSEPIKEIMVKMLLTKNSIYDVLTPREMEVLKKICRGKSQRQIAFDMSLSVNTVRQFSNMLRRKLHVSRTADLIAVAVNSGFYMPG